MPRITKPKTESSLTGTKAERRAAKHREDEQAVKVYRETVQFDRRELDCDRLRTPEFGHLSEIVRLLSLDDANDDQRKIASTGLAWIELMLKKNRDYGSSVWKKPPFAPNMSAGDAILVRLGDKISRLQSLLSKPTEVKDESIRDTLGDAAAYILLLLACPDFQPNGEV